jgi:hypothetical protein
MSRNTFRQGEPLFGEFLHQDSYLSAYLENGGSNNMKVNGSVTPVTFSYTIPADTRVALNRGFVVLEDGATSFVPGNFGQISTGLTNGVEISVTPSGGSPVVLENWKTNREVRDTMFDFDEQWRTAGTYIGRWSFTKDLNQNGIVLKTGDAFNFKIQDDLSSLEYFSFKLKGIKKLTN